MEAIEIFVVNRGWKKIGFDQFKMPEIYKDFHCSKEYEKPFSLLQAYATEVRTPN